MADQLPSKESADTRSRLLDAAIAEFAAKGFESATVRDICQRAQANLNAVKYYFTDKHGLYVESVKEAHRRQKPQSVLDSDDATVEPCQRLHQFISSMLRMLMQDDPSGGAFHRLMLRELAEPSEATAEIVQQFIGPRFALLNSILEAILGPGVDESERHLLAFSVVGECMHYRIASPIIELLLPESEQAKLDVPRIANHVCDVILAAAAKMSARSSQNSPSCELP